jgi:hypothetical protein
MLCIYITVSYMTSRYPLNVVMESIYLFKSVIAPFCLGIPSLPMKSPMLLGVRTKSSSASVGLMNA